MMHIKRHLEIHQILVIQLMVSADAEYGFISSAVLFPNVSAAHLMKLTNIVFMQVKMNYSY